MSNATASPASPANTRGASSRSMPPSDPPASAVSSASSASDATAETPSGLTAAVADGTVPPASVTVPIPAAGSPVRSLIPSVSVLRAQLDQNEKDRRTLKLLLKLAEEQEGATA